MVVNPGWPRVAAAVLVFIGTSGVAFAIFGRFLDDALLNAALGGLLALISFVVRLHPNNDMAMLAPLVGVWRHRRIAPAKLALQPQ
jgi:hypothetical protein